MGFAQISSHAAKVRRRPDGLPSTTEPKESLLAQASASQNGEKVRSHHYRRKRCSARSIFPATRLCKRLIIQGEKYMSGQVVLYFDDQADALRFALAAGQVMAGESGKFTNDLLQETARVTRIRLDAVNAGQVKKRNPGRVA